MQHYWSRNGYRQIDVGPVLESCGSMQIFEPPWTQQVLRKASGPDDTTGTHPGAPPSWADAFKSAA